MVKVNAADTDPDKKGGSDVLPGKYHVIVNKVTENSDNVAVEYQFLAGNPEGQEGKTWTDKFFLSGGSVQRLCRFCEVVGIITHDEWVAAKEAGINMELAVEEAEGRQLCIEIQSKPYQGSNDKNKGKSFPDTGFRLYSLDSDEAKDIPKDVESLKLIYGDDYDGTAGAAAPTTPPPPAGNPAGANATAPAGQADTAAAASAAKKSPWANVGKGRKSA